MQINYASEKGTQVKAMFAELSENRTAVLRARVAELTTMRQLGKAILQGGIGCNNAKIMAYQKICWKQGIEAKRKDFVKAIRICNHFDGRDSFGIDINELNESDINDIIVAAESENENTKLALIEAKRKPEEQIRKEHITTEIMVLVATHFDAGNVTEIKIIRNTIEDLLRASNHCKTCPLGCKVKN